MSGSTVTLVHVPSTRHSPEIELVCVFLIRYCQRATCGTRGIEPNVSGGAKDYTLEVPVLLARIRERLSAEH